MVPEARNAAKRHDAMLADLLLAVLVLSVLGALVAVGVALGLGRRALATRLLRITGAVLAGYALLVLTSSALARREELPAGELLCFDDWCLGVEHVRREPDADGVTCTLTLRLASRARRVAQRETDLELSLEDDQGRRYPASDGSASVPLDTRLGPGESVTTECGFHVTPTARLRGLVVAHGGFPIRWFLLGEGPFRPPPLVRLDSRRE